MTICVFDSVFAKGKSNLLRKGKIVPQKVRAKYISVKMHRMLPRKTILLGFPVVQLKSTASYLRFFSDTSMAQKNLESDAEIDEYLSKPTWSVKSLLPEEKHSEDETGVTPKKLHHLLRLSALPPPSNVEEETKMLRDLRAQLHFVKEIQKVNTDDVEPMKSIRDESARAHDSNIISLETLKDALSQEEIVGKQYKRIRRRKDAQVDAKDVEDWDVLGQAPNKVGKYFVIKADRP